LEPLSRWLAEMVLPGESAAESVGTALRRPEADPVPDAILSPGKLCHGRMAPAMRPGCDGEPCKPMRELADGCALEPESSPPTPHCREVVKHG
jgi:hypothetical protein